MTAQYFAPVSSPHAPRLRVRRPPRRPVAGRRRPGCWRAVGYAGVDALIDAAVPAAIRTARPLDLPPALSETAALARLRELAARNSVLTSMIGLGYYGTDHPGRDPAQRPGEPRLVHRLHARTSRRSPRAASRRC